MGEISHTPHRHKNDNGSTDLCVTLTTYERMMQKGQSSEHAEVHLVRLTGDMQNNTWELGQWVHLEGKIKTTSFIDEQLIKRYKTEVIAYKIHSLQRVGANSGKQTMAQGESNQRQ